MKYCFKCTYPESKANLAKFAYDDARRAAASSDIVLHQNVFFGYEFSYVKMLYL